MKTVEFGTRIQLPMEGDHWRDILPAKARYDSDNDADFVIVSTFPADDEQKEIHLEQILTIARNSEAKVIAHSSIGRMEDAKKLIYAGCSAVIMESEQFMLPIMDEVVGKFGSDKVWLHISSYEEYQRVTEAERSWDGNFIFFDYELLKSVSSQTLKNIIVDLPEMSLDRLIGWISQGMIVGITGDMIQNNIAALKAMKHLCLERGIAVNTFVPQIDWMQLKLNSDGLIPVVVQDYKTDEVLMLAYMNEESFHKTLHSGKMTYFSRSRQELWLKGDTSGNYQYVKSLHADCDYDTLLAKVSQTGFACHTGSYSCFFREIAKKSGNYKNPLEVFEDVYRVIEDRKINPKEGSYTNYLFDKGIDKILKKVGEECTEIVIASKNPNANEIKYEIADFLYHTMVLMVEKGVTWKDITDELSRRE